MTAAHHLTGVEFPKGPRRARVVAVCSCGWRSEEQPSAGLAESLWDMHEAAPTSAAVRGGLDRVRPARPARGRSG